MSVYFITEDTFGGLFIKQVIEKKTKEGIIPRNIRIVKTESSGRCNPRIGRLVKIAVNIAERIIIIVDSEGREVQRVFEETMAHVAPLHRERVRIIVMNYEIEEWICLSLGLRLEGNKPSDVLKREERHKNRDGYKKYNLPDFAKELDCEKLRKSSDSFRRFLSALP